MRMRKMMIHHTDNVAYQMVYSGRLRTGVLLFFGILFLSYVQDIGDASAALWYVLKGFSYGRFLFVEFLYYIAPAAYILFCLHASWEAEAGETSYLFMLRTGSRKAWDTKRREADRQFIRKNAVLLLLTVILAALPVLVGKNSNSGTWSALCAYYGLSHRQSIGIAALALLFRIIEWHVLSSFGRFIYSVTGKTILAFVLSLLLFVPGFMTDGFWILGRGSLYQLLDVNNTGGKITVIVLVILVMLNFIFSKIETSSFVLRRKETLCQK